MQEIEGAGCQSTQQALQPQASEGLMGIEEAFHRQPVLLILDDELQQLPWESLPGLRGQQYVPS